MTFKRNAFSCSPLKAKRARQSRLDNAPSPVTMLGDTPEKVPLPVWRNGRRTGLKIPISPLLRRCLALLANRTATASLLAQMTIRRELIPPAWVEADLP